MAMDRASLARARWRYRGAWLWPMFVVLSLIDGLIGYALPVSGRQQSVVGGVVVGLALNLLAVVLLSRPLGAVLRRRRRDLPAAVARNYAGTLCLALITAGFAAAGLVNRSNIRTDDAAYRDALVRAEAYIGDRAPAQFRRNAAHADTFTIQPDSIYRTCVPNDAHTRTYCVIVRRSLPLARSVVFGGYEPNSVFAAGAN
jgi:hypothetical protein